MLRTSIRSVRALGSRPVAAAAGRQWHAAVVRPARVGAGERCYADDKKPSIADPTPAALPKSETRTSVSGTPPPPTEKTADALPEVATQNVPLTPPAPEAVVAPAAAKSTPPPPPPPPPAATPVTPKKKGFFRRLRNYFLTISILGALAFGGGVWYSRVSDNFHDFFTEYVPFGEQAVLYLEESDFRKRFPNVSTRITSHRDGGPQVKIPASSGASWRVADSGEPAGRQSSAVRKVEAAQDAAAKNPDAKKTESAGDSVPKAVAQPPKPTADPDKVPTAVAGAVPVTSSSDAAGAPATPKIVEPTTPAAKEAPVWKAPEVDEPSRFPPASPIDPLAVNDATEPLVQELVHMLNDIIYVINADGANDRYGATIDKAKRELNGVGRKVKELKAAVEAEAAKEVKARVDDFDKAANDLVSRVEAAMAAQEASWRREFEEEMARIKAGYDEKVKLVQERQRQVDEEKAANRLLEQAIELQRQFADEVKTRVEQERDGRLGRLGELSSAVAELERLTTGWNDVVDTNIRTQQLHVAVDAVRASLEDTAHHPRPFIKELVALKEIAADDAVVGAAIASINPSAYQRGIATPAELVERFRRVAAEVRKASLLPDDAGVASHASSLILSKLMFKKQGLADGDDVESVLTRTATYLEEGDLDNAAREMNGLTGWAKTLSRDWLGEVRKVLEVQQALEVIQTEARLQSLRVE